VIGLRVYFIHVNYIIHTNVCCTPNKTKFYNTNFRLQNKISIVLCAALY
jgi:hypothetical protein